MASTKAKPPQRTKIHLKRLPDIRRLLNRCINENLQGTMDNDKLRAITYATQSMAKVFELLDVERRLDRLEQEAQRGK
jgi:hypothetical protein